MWKLFLAFTIIPAIELYLLIQLGQWMGAGATVALIVLTGSVGAWLAKREGLSVLRSIRDEASKGFPSGDRIIEGLMVLIGGALLLTPGVLTDFVGFSLIIPLTRRAAAPLIKKAVLGWFGFQPIGSGAEPPGPLGQELAPEERSQSRQERSPKSSPFDHPSL